MFTTHNIPDRSLAAHFHSIPGLCGEVEVSLTAKNGKSGTFGWGPVIASGMPSECKARMI